MRAHRWLVFAPSLVLFGSIPSAASAQEPAPTVPCRERPCAVVVDWTRAGGLGSQNPDRRYGNPAQLEERLQARLTERGYARYASSDAQDLRILMQPVVRNAMCDQLPGTATDMSCRAIVEVETRIEGPDDVTRDIDLPPRLRGRCASDQTMAVEQFAVFLADWIIYAVEGRAKGERRPVARC